MVYSWASFSCILYKVQSTTSNQYFDTYLFIVLSILLRYCIIIEHILLSELFDDIELYEKGIKIHKAYVQQFHRCLFIESTIIDDFFDQFSIVRGIFFLIKNRTTNKSIEKRIFWSNFLFNKKKEIEVIGNCIEFWCIFVFKLCV